VKTLAHSPGMTREAILIVEDSAPCASTLEIALSALPGFDVILAASCEAAILLIQAATPRVAAIVTDLHLPGMDGFDLIRQVRQNHAAAALPIIVVSGDSDPSAPERVIAMGASAFFGKPFSPAAVRRTLEQLLYARPSDRQH
jgi:two-component system, chemotaxis family, chemotaxis protein CheY